MTLLFGIYIHGRPHEVFLSALESATYFWAFLKLLQLIGGVSLLANYKPVLGFSLLIPIASVMLLFYLFELHSFLIFGALMLVSIVILFRAYAKSFRGFLDNY